MDTLNQLLSSGRQLSHHAYALIAKGKDYSKRVLDFLKEKLGVETRGNPDVFVQQYELLTIDDARALKDAHATRPFAEGGRKFFVLEAESITHEAQNALLKVFEEPNEYAHFFLVIPSEETLLPTLRSRLHIVRGGEEGSDFDDSSIRNFVSSAPAERIAFVDKLAADIADGKKPKSAALELCASISRYLRTEGIEKNAKALTVLAETESYLRDRAPSVKQLLEYAALGL